MKVLRHEAVKWSYSSYLRGLKQCHPFSGGVADNRTWTDEGSIISLAKRVTALLPEATRRLANYAVAVDPLFYVWRQSDTPISQDLKGQE